MKIIGIDIRIEKLKAYDRGFEAGQQSRQAEVDELQKRIDEAWSWCEKGCVLKAMEILKGKSDGGVDVVCIHNFDYNGFITIKKVKSFIEFFEGLE